MNNYCPHCGTTLTTSLDNMGTETMHGLLLGLETAVIKLVESRSSTAPISVQVMKSLNAVKNSIKTKSSLKGREAVVAFLEANKGHFLSDFPPIKKLVRKYKEIQINRSGEAYLPIEA